MDMERLLEHMKISSMFIFFGYFLPCFIFLVLKETDIEIKKEKIKQLLYRFVFFVCGAFLCFWFYD